MAEPNSSTRGPLITLTGVDERTSRADLRRLLDASPRVEIGILITADPEGRHRYPGAEWAMEMALEVGKRCAVHVCGRRARAMVLDGKERAWLSGVGRIQINGAPGVLDLQYALKLAPEEIITQHSERTRDLARLSFIGHSILVDRSGGRGVLPDAWVRPETTAPVGFAGGLSPDNLEVELPKIAAVARHPWWIDMETGLRDADDWFSVEKALRCVEIFEQFLAGAA